MGPTGIPASFETLSDRDLPEFRGRGIRVRHRATGLEAYHLRTEDEENVFAFCFGTLPGDSTGVAHILEHSVLCGSERYPLKDSFLLLAKGSLSTFLNAFTFPDKTVYPAASALEADYFNLMAVYADAAFFPLVSRLTFMQEGHRLELGPSGAPEFKGVVYNEMKGSYSSADGIASDWAFRSLLPGGPYAHDSGGDPAVIPSLRYEDFLEFHRRNYAPSNCKLFLYGNIDTGKQLAFVEERILSRHAAAAPLPPPAPLVPRFPAPIRLDKPYPAADGATTIVLVNWLAGDALEGDEALALELLAEALLGHDGSPLALALKESGLGEDLASQCGLESELRELVFTAGLRGCPADRAGELESLALSALERLAREGIPGEAVEAALRFFEFSNREIKRGSYPYGLRLMRRSLRAWLHGGGPEDSLLFEQPFARIKARIEGGERYLERLIAERLVGNPHRSLLVVHPDPALSDRERAREESAAASALAAMGPGGRERVAAEAAGLKAAQDMPDAPEALASMPCVGPADIPRRVETIPREGGTLAGLPYLRRDIATNGIAYLDLAFEADGARGFPTEAFPWLPLLCRAIGGTGLDGRKWHETSSDLARLTGAFSCSVQSSAALDGRTRSFVFARAKYLAPLAGEALPLVLGALARSDFTDRARLRDLAVEIRNDFVSSLVPSGSSFAALRSQSRFTDAYRVSEMCSGIYQAYFISALLEEPDAPDRIAAALEALRGILLSRASLSVNLTAQGSALAESESLLASLLPSLPAGPRAASPGAFSHAESLPPADREAFTAPSGVGFAAESLRASRIGTAACAHEQLLAHELSTSFLWEEIRMKGGAYGAGLSVDGMEGCASFSTYRDPAPLASMALFGKSLEAAASAAMSEEGLAKAKVGLASRDLRPLAPEEKGFVDFRRSLYSIDDEVRQARRDRMLAASPSDLRIAAERLLGAYAARKAALIADPSALAGAEGFRRRELPS